MNLAVLLSLLLHVAGFAVLHYTYIPAPPVRPANPEPLVLNLQPDPPPQPNPPPRQLVDIVEPAPEPPVPTENIAETHSEAMDLARLEDPQRGPALEQDDFDALPKAASPDKMPAPAAPPPPPKAEEKEPSNSEEAEMQVKEIETPLEEVLDPDEADEHADSAPEAPLRIAQNTPPAPPARPSPGTTRERGSRTKQGTTNFDAIQNEIAPYLKQIRQQVERRWNEMLYTRYSGTSPAKAVIDCAINPQGQLVSVSIVGADGDRLYSALCKDAIQRAGPFGPFPFEVPDIYKDKNLEIRWTFNFL